MAQFEKLKDHFSKQISFSLHPEAGENNRFKDSEEAFEVPCSRASFCRKNSFKIEVLEAQRFSLRINAHEM